VKRSREKAFPLQPVEKQLLGQGLAIPAQPPGTIPEAQGMIP
jgi:hypothetical protein